MSQTKSQTQSRNWRLLGILPLMFFVARLAYFTQHGGVSQILWMCHFSNLTLAIGLVFNLPLWIGISAYWLLLGIPFWVIDIIGFGLEGLTSAATHIGGMTIALLALYRFPTRRRLWFHALGWYLFLQLVCRWFTPPELNINIAHAVYRGWEGIYANYTWYWLLTTAGAGIALCLLDGITISLNR